MIVLKIPTRIPPIIPDISPPGFLAVTSPGIPTEIENVNLSGIPPHVSPGTLERVFVEFLRRFLQEFLIFKSNPESENMNESFTII